MTEDREEEGIAAPLPVEPAEVAAAPDIAAATAESAPTLPEPRRLHPALALMGFLGLLVGSVVAVQLIWRAIAPPRSGREEFDQPIPLFAFGVALVLVTTGVTWLSARWFEGRGLRTVGLGLGPGFLRRVAVGLFFGGLTPALVVLALAIAGIATITRTTPDLLAVTLPMFLATALLSVWEELLLRGYFMQTIGAMGGPWVASIVSGVIFGLMHAGNPGANMAGLVITAVNGILLALLAARTGSLWLVCGYHAGWNLVAAMLLGMRDSGMDAPGSLLATDLKGPTLWTGGAYGFEASLLTFLVEAVILAALLVYAPRRLRDAEAWPYYQRKG